MVVYPLSARETWIVRMAGWIAWFVLAAFALFALWPTVWCFGALVGCW